MFDADRSSLQSHAGRRVLLACAVALSLLPASWAGAGEVSRVVDAFVEALRADDLGAFEAIAETPVSGLEWSAIRELAETSRCIEVHSYRASTEGSDAHGATIRLDLDATRLTRGASRERVPVPSSWMLEIACGPEVCRVHSVEKRARVVARALVAARDDERESILRAAGADEAEVARELVDEAIFAPVPYEKDAGEGRLRAFELGLFARELAHRSGDRAAEAECLRLFATAVRVVDQDADAVAAEAVDAACQIGDADAVAAATFSRGILHWFNGDTPGGLRDLRTASATLDKLRDPRIGLKALAMESFISIECGQLRAGLATARRLEQESERYGWVEGESSAATYLATVHFILNTTEMNRRYLEIAYQKALEARNAKNALFALTDLAYHDTAVHDYDRAVLGFRRALASSGPESGDDVRARMFGGLAAALLRAGRLAEADQASATALGYARASDPVTRSVALSTLAALRLAQRRPEDALPAAQESVALLAGKSPPPDWLWSAQDTAGRALKQLGRTGEAENAFRATIEFIETGLSQLDVDGDAATRYFDDKRDPYGELAELLVDGGRAYEALRVSERMRARALTAVLEQGKVDVSASMTAAEKERERELNARLTGLNRTLLDKPESRAARAARDAARLDLDCFREELYVSRPTLRLRLPAGEQALTMPAALADTTVVEYIVRDGGVIAIAARRARDGRTLTTARWIPLSRRRLEARAAAFSHAIEERDAAYRQRARELYDLLLLPVEEQVRSRTRLCIIPDGVLWRLPFQALVDREGRHVIERRPLFYAASLRTLALAAAEPRRRRLAELLALGDPQLTPKIAADAVAFQRDAPVGALPDARREVESIRRLYPAGASTVLVGSAATEAAFKREAAHYRVLHIAAHGFFDEQAPMYSALLLTTAGGNEDGFLEAREIADLQLHSDVAILSACETARGAYGAGEGLIGLSWALQVAGCPTAIVSQSKVASAATARLMIAFHRHLLAGASKSESLRRASLELMRTRQYANPFYWAPFILVGAP
jgi:CHAT domain-containing protein